MRVFDAVGGNGNVSIVSVAPHDTIKVLGQLSSHLARAGSNVVGDPFRLALVVGLVELDNLIVEVVAVIRAYGHVFIPI